MLINVNGQNYDKWEDVPPEIRQKLAARLPDADKNGVPDVFEGNLSGLAGDGAQTFTSISVDGHDVGSVGELPPDVQQTLQQALGWLTPGAATAAAAPATGIPAAAGAPAAPAAVPPGAAAAPLQPGQVMLNGVPVTVGTTAPEKKGFWRRLFGG